MAAHSHLNFREVVDRFVTSCKSRRDLRELAGLDDANFSAIARDLRLSPRDFEAVARNDGRWSANLGELLDSLGIDRAEAIRTEPAVMRDMERVCAVCPAAARCGRDLRVGHARWTYREYCANSPTIEALEELRLCQRRASV
jgi:hypothetical protein